MLLENAGKKITNIKINKRNVVVSFNKQKITISHSAYTLFYLYVGKQLSVVEINKLKKYSRLSAFYEYALSFLKRNHYSEFNMRQKLFDKGASKKDINEVINRLKSIDLINDDMLAEDILCFGNDKKYGKKRIQQMMFDKGLFEKTILKVRFLENEEIEKAEFHLSRLGQKYNELPFIKIKQKVYLALYSLGFDDKVINNVIHHLKKPEKEIEMNSLRHEYDKAKIRLSRRYEGDVLYSKVFKYLINKGYLHQDVKQLIKEDDYEINK